MQISIINVGYGDAILFHLNNNRLVMLDGGSNLDTEFIDNEYRIRSSEYLLKQGIKHIDTLIVSHIHEDHVGGLKPLVEKISIGQLVMPYPVEMFRGGRQLEVRAATPRSVPMYTTALNTLREIVNMCLERNIPIKSAKLGETLVLDEELSFDVLAPHPKYMQPYVELLQAAYNSQDDQFIAKNLTELDITSNSTSLLLKTNINGHNLLFAADCAPRYWDELDPSVLNDVNFLKLPHHGQVDSISVELMRSMPLEMVVTTASSDHRYNSANNEVYAKLTEINQSGKAPRFLFQDEREYNPWFTKVEGFQAIKLDIKTGSIEPEFIKI